MSKKVLTWAVYIETGNLAMAESIYLDSFYLKWLGQSCLVALASGELIILLLQSLAHLYYSCVPPCLATAKLFSLQIIHLFNKYLETIL